MAGFVLEFLCAREVNPVALAQLARQNGISEISVCIKPFKSLGKDALPFGDIIDWDLIGDTANRRELKRRCEGEGVRIASADVFFMLPDTDVESFRSAVESAAFLNAASTMVIPLDPDRSRLQDKVHRLALMNGEYGLRLIHEHSPRMAIKSIRESLEFQRGLGLDNVRMMIDTLHFFRGNNSIADLAGIAAEEVSRIQLCDGPAEYPPEGGGYEAFFERMIPGEGVFPLREIVGALPTEIDVGLEVPLWQLQQQGVQPAERVRLIVEASRRLLGDRVT